MASLGPLEHNIANDEWLLDVAFQVDSVDAVYRQAVRKGASVVAEPHASADELGKVRLASIRTYGDTVHTLVERGSYSGVFLPGYRPVVFGKDPLSELLPSVQLEAIDHCVGNQDWNEMDDVCE